MDILFGLITALLIFCQGMFYKLYGIVGGKVQATSDNINFYNFAIGSLIMVTIALLSAPFDSVSVMYGLVQGVIFWVMTMSFGKAVTSGKISLCNFVMALSMLLPIVYGALSPLVQEYLSPLKMVGIAVFLIASYLVCFGEKGDGKKVPVSSYIFLAIAGTVSGVQSIWIKYTGYVYPEVDRMYVLATMFLVALVLSCITRGIVHGRSVYIARLNNAQYVAPRYRVRPLVWCTLGVSLAMTFGNLAFNVFQGIVEGAVFYPVANGLPMIVAVLLSPLFKEKVTRTAMVGVLIGVVAVILLNI